MNRYALVNDDGLVITVVEAETDDDVINPFGQGPPVVLVPKNDGGVSSGYSYNGKTFTFGQTDDQAAATKIAEAAQALIDAKPDNDAFLAKPDDQIAPAELVAQVKALTAQLSKLGTVAAPDARLDATAAEVAAVAAEVDLGG